MPIILLILTLFFAAPAMAQDMDYTVFKTLPVLHEGRIKPLSSFARLYYQQLQDSAYVMDDEAIHFLAQSLFDPAQAAEEKTIVIRDENLRRTLGLDDKRKNFSLSEIIEPLSRHDKDIALWLQQDPKTLQPEQKSMIMLYDKMVGFTQILRSFTSILPLEMNLPTSIKARYTDAPDLSFYALQSKEETLRRDIMALVKQRGKNLDKYTSSEQRLVELSYQIDQIRQSGMGNTLFRVIPHGWDESWSSPWDILLDGQSSPESVKALNAWQGAVFAWRKNNVVQFTMETKKIDNLMKIQKSVSPFSLLLEQFYYTAHLLPLSLFLYVATFILLLARQRIFPLALCLGAFSVHALSIVVRILILQRPPVSTLFESVLFVGFIAVLGLLLAEAKFKNKSGLMLAAITGALLQITALGFASNGDTLQNLQAVLNTSFWLAVHVLVISAGYGTCMICSVLAQTSFLWRDKISDGLLWFASTLSLLLTSVGTILGGLWADQSWGRFWGWDPKENGALLIVLWLSWALHARLSGHFDDTKFRAALALLSVIVSLAWFGVNLLSTGLHSYGFTSGIAAVLFSFIGLQSAFIAFLYWRERRRLHA